MSLTLTENFILDTTLVDDDADQSTIIDGANIIVMNPNNNIIPVSYTCVNTELRLFPTTRPTWYEGEVMVKVVNEPDIWSVNGLLSTVNGMIWRTDIYKNDGSGNGIWTAGGGGDSCTWNAVAGNWKAYANQAWDDATLDLVGTSFLPIMFRPTRVKLVFYQGINDGNFKITQVKLKYNNVVVATVNGNWLTGDEIDLSGVGIGYCYNAVSFTFMKITSGLDVDDVFIDDIQWLLSDGISQTTAVHAGIRNWDDVTDIQYWNTYPDTWDGSKYICTSNNGPYTYVQAQNGSGVLKHAIHNDMKYDKVRITYSNTTTTNTTYSFRSGIEVQSYIPIASTGSHITTFNRYDEFVRFDIGNQNLGYTITKIEFGYPVV